MDASKHRRLLNKTLLLWGLFAGFFLVMSIPSGPPPSAGFVLAWFAFVTGVLAAVGIPLIYALLRMQNWLSARLRGRGLLRAPPPPEVLSGPPTPFRYSGRRWKAPAGASAGILFFLAFAWILPRTGEAVYDGLLAVLRWLVLAFAAVVLAASLFGLRMCAFEVDDRGVRVRGRFRPFDVLWEDIARLETSRLTGFPFPSPEEALFPKMYALWRKSETVAGIVTPTGELSRRDGPAFEGALLAYARARGIPIVEVPWQAVRLWWRMRKRTGPTSSP